MSIKIDFSGLNKFERDLKSLNSQVSFGELFNNDFMCKHTRFNSFENMLEQSGFTVNTDEDFKAIPDDEWDHFISSNTDFGSWQEMLNEAAAEHITRQLGL